MNKAPLLPKMKEAISRHALMEDTNGSIWIGTSGGLSHLCAPDNNSSERQPPLIFEQVSYDGTPMNSSHRIEWNNGVLANPEGVAAAIMEALRQDDCES